ncbi:MAG: hypothetical protein MI685_10605 [Chlorobiales bacterium]|nr:hypothetical protein [Chlorobiales bacterium]
MDFRTIHSVRLHVEEEIGRLHKEIEACKMRTEECIGRDSSAEKKEALVGIKKEFDSCRFRLEEIATMLESLGKQKLEVEGVLSETAALLDKNLQQAPPPEEDQGFSASSISPLA